MGNDLTSLIRASWFNVIQSKGKQRGGFCGFLFFGEYVICVGDGNAEREWQRHRKTSGFQFPLTGLSHSPTKQKQS